MGPNTRPHARKGSRRRPMPYPEGWPKSKLRASATPSSPCDSDVEVVSPPPARNKRTPNKLSKRRPSKNRTPQPQQNASPQHQPASPSRQPVSLPPPPAQVLPARVQEVRRHRERARIVDQARRERTKSVSIPSPAKIRDRAHDRLIRRVREASPAHHRRRGQNPRTVVSQEARNPPRVSQSASSPHVEPPAQQLPVLPGRPREEPRQRRHSRSEPPQHRRRPPEVINLISSDSNQPQTLGGPVSPAPEPGPILGDCGICLETLTRPILLPCEQAANSDVLHSFCRTCLITAIAKAPGGIATAKCPTCRFALQRHHLDFAFGMQKQREDEDWEDEIRAIIWADERQRDREDEEERQEVARLAAMLDAEDLRRMGATMPPPPIPRSIGVAPPVEGGRVPPSNHRRHPQPGRGVRHRQGNSYRGNPGADLFEDLVYQVLDELEDDEEEGFIDDFEDPAPARPPRRGSLGRHRAR